jgi:hypothetical protein
MTSIKKKDKRKKIRHTIGCIKKHLLEHGNYLLGNVMYKMDFNKSNKRSEFQKGCGDGLLRALDLLEGRITGDGSYIYPNRCICRPKRVQNKQYYADGWKLMK